MIQFKYTDGYGLQTQTAGTVISFLIPGRHGLRTYLTFLRYTQGSTVHTVTVMRHATETKLTADAAASQAVINVQAALKDGGGNAIASGDYVGVEQDDGTWFLSTFSSASSLAYTLAANLTTTSKTGSKVVCFGVAGDAFHANYGLKGTASATTNFPNSGNEPLFAGRGTNAPLLVQSSNGTTAGQIENMTWGYAP